MSKIRIAIFVHGLSGGVGKVLLNYFSHMSNDYDIDLITMYIESEELLNSFEKNGFNVIKIPSKKESFIKNIKSMYEILHKKKYDIAYAHMTLTNCFPLFIAYISGINVRISHSHLAENRNWFNSLLSFATKLLSTNYLACSKEAGKFLYDSSDFKVLNNAIDIDKYKYSECLRKKCRQSLNIKDSTTVIGNVGRFSRQKNHEFLIKIFKDYHKINPNSLLMMIGSGELKEKIMAKVNEYGLDEYVIFVGEVQNVNEYLQAMDIFLQPSLYEGLSLAAVEAQASGLPCILSDTVSSETKITSNVSFLPLENSTDTWVNKCIEFSEKKRRDTSKIVKENGYDINTEAVLFDQYLKLQLKH